VARRSRNLTTERFFPCPNCGAETEKFWSFNKCPICGQKYPVAQVEAYNSLTDDEQGKLAASYEALYVDGYKHLPPSNSVVLILKEEIQLLIGETAKRVRIKVGYKSIELLNILQEREITAMRTFLVGPVLAAWLKKKARMLAVGFRDELGLFQIPTFKMDESDISKCYDTIIENVRQCRSPQSENAAGP
jgi:hypothetical protein